MYAHSIINEALRGLVGFDSNYIVNKEQVDADLQGSESGIYATRLHPLLTYDNIGAIADLFRPSNVLQWNQNTTYRAGDLVQDDFVVHRSLKGGNKGIPLTDTEYWQPTTLLSVYLRHIYDGAVVKLFNQLFTEKKLNETAKTLLTQVALYEGVGNLTGRIIKSGRVAGFKLTVKHPDTVAKLTHIGLQLDTAQQDVKVYLYHTSSNLPVKEFILNHTRSVQFQWHSIEAQVLAYLNDTINAGGSYYLAYYEDELTGSAIRKDYSFAGGFCGSCSEGVVNRRLHNQWSQYITVQPFYVAAGNANADKSLWDESAEVYTDDNTFGVNIQMSVQCDVTDLMVRHKAVLAGPLAQQIVVDLLTAMTYSLRDNTKRDRIAGLAAVALDNTENYQSGELKKLRDSIKALSFDFSNMSPVCLPCGHTAGSVRKKSIWG